MNLRRNCFESAGSTVLAGWLLVAAAAFLAAPSLAADERVFRNWVTLRDAGVVRQARDFSCGVAALATYLTYYLDTPVTEEDLLTLLNQYGNDWALPVDWREQGVSYAVLRQLGQYYGLQGAGMAVTPELLGSLTVPAIVRLEVDGVAHFSVLRGIGKRGQVQLADPSWGNHRLSRDAFLALWLAPGLGDDVGTLMLFQPVADSSLAPDADYFGVDARQPLLRPPA